MSLYISTKSIRQCRTYHKTMLKKFENIKNIVKDLIHILKGKKQAK